MRVWDITPEKLCRNHLLGEHREVHAIWVILTKGKKGYRRHPEVLRWEGKLKSLYARHARLVREISGRGYRHASDLNPSYATGKLRQTQHVNTHKEQVRILKRKGCGCRV